MKICWGQSLTLKCHTGITILHFKAKVIHFVPLLGRNLFVSNFVPSLQFRHLDGGLCGQSCGYREQEIVVPALQELIEPLNLKQKEEMGDSNTMC